MPWQDFLAYFEGLGPDSAWVAVHADVDGYGEPVNVITDPDAGERAFAAAFGLDPSEVSEE